MLYTLETEFKPYTVASKMWDGTTVNVRCNQYSGHEGNHTFQHPTNPHLTLTAHWEG